MTIGLQDERLDAAIRHFLERRAADTSGIADADHFVRTLAAVTGPEVLVRRRASRTTLMLAAAITLLAVLASAVIVGNLPRPDRLAVVSPTPTTVPSPSVTPSTIPVATTRPTPMPIPFTEVGSGSADSPIGRLRWLAYEGDASSIPADDSIFTTPDGFGALELLGTWGRSGTRYSESADGITWVPAPLPVPASGRVHHALEGGEHYLWSDADFRIWRSTDFRDWRATDLSFVRPTPIEGVEWNLGGWQVAAGHRGSILLFQVFGWVALDVLLGMPAVHGETLTLGQPRSEGTDVRMVRVRRATETADGAEPYGQPIATLRISRWGATVDVTHVEADRLVLSIDADALGVEPARLLNSLAGGFVPGPGGIVAIDANASQAVPWQAANVAGLGVAADGRFVMLHRAANREHEAWTSDDGLDWTSSGPIDGPAAPDGIRLLTGSRGPGEPVFVAEVLMPERFELWTSNDGIRWTTVDQESVPAEFAGGKSRTGWGGFFAPAEDFRLYTSATGASWIPIAGIEGILRSVSEHGGGSMTSAAGDRLFIVELPLDGPRRLWILVREGASTP